MMRTSEVDQLNVAVDKTIDAIEGGKKEIFEISESTRSYCLSLEEEYVILKSNLALIIDEVDRLEIKEKMARNMIQTISAHFDEFCENDIKEAYELANSVRVELSLKRAKEKDFKNRRNEIEVRLRESKEMLNRSEVLAAKVSVALEYLTSNLFEQLEDIKQKKEVGLKIIEAQENERHRMSRDIHDGPAQSMANIILKSEYCERIIDIDPSKVKGELGELKADVRETLRDLRKIIYDLMPMSLEDLGLVPTIYSLLNDITSTTDIKVQTDIRETIKIKDRLIKLSIFRLIQETLNNVKKHARASSVWLVFHIEPTGVYLKVKDNGIGFDAKLVELTNSKENGYGLYNIRDRVDILGGEISIDSQHKKGTTIEVNIPLSHEEVEINE